MAQIVALLIDRERTHVNLGCVYWEPIIRLSPRCRGFPLHRQTG